MKYNLVVITLISSPFAHSNSQAVEESFRAMPPGATDLVPRVAPAEAIDREPIVYHFTVETWHPPEYTNCYQKSNTELFSPAEPITLSTASWDTENEN